MSCPKTLEMPRLWITQGRRRPVRLTSPTQIAGAHKSGMDIQWDSAHYFGKPKRGNTSRTASKKDRVGTADSAKYDFLSIKIY